MSENSPSLDAVRACAPRCPKCGSSNVFGPSFNPERGYHVACSDCRYIFEWLSLHQFAQFFLAQDGRLREQTKNLILWFEYALRMQIWDVNDAHKFGKAIAEAEKVLSSVPVPAQEGWQTRPLAFDDGLVLASITYSFQGKPMHELIVCQLDDDGADLMTHAGDDIGWTKEVVVSWLPICKLLPSPPKPRKEG